MKTKRVLRLRVMFVQSGIGAVALAAGVLGWTPPAGAATYGHSSSLSPRLSEARIVAREDPARRHTVVVSLDLTNGADLESFLADVQNPASPNYRHFLAPKQFNSRYAPSPEVEQRLVDHLQASGLHVTQRFPNRLLVATTGSVAALEATFGVELYTVTFRGEAHYAAINEPSLPDDLAPHILGVIGLDDLVTRRPHGRARRTAFVPLARFCYVWGCNYSFSPTDLTVFYDGGTYDGSGQTIVIAGAYKWLDSDVTSFDSQWGLPPLPTGSAQVCTGTPTAAGCKIDFSPADNSIEITMDVESAHGIAPGARILNYMAASTYSVDFITMYNWIVTDNPGHVVTTSWGSCEAETSPVEQTIDDIIFANANAIGQSWFAASGDNGSTDCRDTAVMTVDHPANSPHVMGAGGTSGTCSGGMYPLNPACAGYGSETAWGGSGGGTSQLFNRPAFQTGCGVPAGSQRLVPDVAFQADPETPGIFVYENGTWLVAGGTSDAAPEWAAILAQLNQRFGGSGLGNPGALLYGMCGTTAFHDITSGSNGDYSAGPGYDQVTGLGSPDIANLLTNVPLPTATPTNNTPTQTPTNIPSAELIPGQGKNRCMLEWLTDPPALVGQNGLPVHQLTCTDDDGSCDFGATTGDSACTFHVAACVNVADSRLPCTPTDVAQVQLRSPNEAKPKDAVAAANRDALENALAGLGGAVRGRCANRGPRKGELCIEKADCGGDGLCEGRFVVFAEPFSGQDACTAFAPIQVPLRQTTTGFKAASSVLRVKATSGVGEKGANSLRLTCKPHA